MTHIRRQMYLMALALLLALIHARTDYRVTNTVKNTTSVLLTLTYTGSESYYVK